jgi:transcription elongation factor B subunit 1
MKKEDTVKLISSDGFEFIVDKEAAMVSQTIRNMLTSPGFLSFDHFTFL